MIDLLNKMLQPQNLTAQEVRELFKLSISNAQSVYSGIAKIATMLPTLIQHLNPAVAKELTANPQYAGLDTIIKFSKEITDIQNTIHTFLVDMQKDSVLNAIASKARNSPEQQAIVDKFLRSILDLPVNPVSTAIVHNVIDIVLSEAKVSRSVMLPWVTANEDYLVERLTAHLITPTLMRKLLTDIASKIHTRSTYGELYEVRTLLDTSSIEFINNIIGYAKQTSYRNTSNVSGYIFGYHVLRSDLSRYNYSELSYIVQVFKVNYEHLSIPTDLYKHISVKSIVTASKGHYQERYSVNSNIGGYIPMMLELCTIDNIADLEQYIKEHKSRLKLPKNPTQGLSVFSNSVIATAPLEEVLGLYKSRYWTELVMFIRGIAGVLTDDEILAALTHTTNSNIQQGAMLFMRTMNDYAALPPVTLKFKEGILSNTQLIEVKAHLPRNAVRLNEVLEQQYTTSYAMYGVFVQTT